MYKFKCFLVSSASIPSQNPSLSLYTQRKSKERREDPEKSIMVVFTPGSPPKVLHAYTNIPLSADLIITIQREFNIGAFARFRNPAVTLSIHDDRPDLYDQSSLAIREILDSEGYTDGFVLIDANVTKPGSNVPGRRDGGEREREPFSTALWWVTSREDSELYNREYTAIEDSHDFPPPITYPGEAFVLWRVRVLIQDLPLQWINWDVGNIDITEVVYHTLSPPYDPHDNQANAHTLGVDFSDKTEAAGSYPGAYIEADYNTEVEISRDMELRERFSLLPSYVVRLTQSAATEAGLISSWTMVSSSNGGEDIPRPGEVVKLQQDYDWDSPKWA